MIKANESGKSPSQAGGLGNGTSLFSQAVKQNQESEDTNYKKVGAWFLGSKAENGKLLSDLIQSSIEDHIELRKNLYVDERDYITNLMDSKEYKAMTGMIEKERKKLSKELEKSVPFYSQRYQGHMLWDTVIPGVVGYITAMLHNQNNVATEASNITSGLEKEAGEQLCGLMDFQEGSSWGHITADGTIANIEAMWAARNLKAYPLAIKDMLNSGNETVCKARDFQLQIVEKSDESTWKCLRSCTDEELWNLDSDTILELLHKISETYAIEKAVLGTALKPFLLATIGIASFVVKHPRFAAMKVFVPATCHYSWPKAGTLLGIGQENIIGIKVDRYCRMDTEELERSLKECYENGTPVLMVVAVMGSTAEGTVDNLDFLCNLKEEYATKGMSFHLHCDAAWGGYLRSIIVKGFHEIRSEKSGYVPFLPLSRYAQTQFEAMKAADTVTIDPHKAGFIPYPAGALCYRNKALREQISFDAAYIHSGGDDVNMGIYGLEGSKPGAAAAAVWLAHKTIPLNQDGYGLILGECCFSAKLFYCYWVTLALPQDTFRLEPLIPLPERIEGTAEVEGFATQEEMKQFIREYILGHDNIAIAGNPRALLLLQEVGADVLINTFVVNFKGKESHTWNTDLCAMNQLNEKLFQHFSLMQADITMENLKKLEYILMMNTVSSRDYDVPLESLTAMLDIKRAEEKDFSMNILSSTVMQPWPNTPEFAAKITNIFKRAVYEEIERM